MRVSWFLKCGSDLVGTITLETYENWHNYGRLKPGPDYARYQTPLDKLWSATQEYDGLLQSEALVSDEELEQSEARKESAEQAMDQFDFCVEDLDTHHLRPIHDFHLIDDLGGVYWRFGMRPAA